MPRIVVAKPRIKPTLSKGKKGPARASPDSPGAGAATAGAHPGSGSSAGDSTDSETPPQPQPRRPGPSPTAPQPPAGRQGMQRMVGSSADLLALNPSVTDAPMVVPPIVIHGPTVTYDDIVTRGVRISPTHIELPPPDGAPDARPQVIELRDVFAAGGYGAVRHAIKPDSLVDQVYVVKEVDGRRGEAPRQTPLPPVPAHGAKTAMLAATWAQDVRNEVNMMLRARSPLAPHLIVRTQDRVFLLMPMAEGDVQGIWTHLRHMPTQPLDRLAHQLLSSATDSLLAVHKAGIAHRDIKPENLFLDRSARVLVGDFGIAVPAAGASAWGTPGWMPPEAFLSAAMLRALKQAPYDAQKADVWSLAASVVALLTNTNFLWPFAVRSATHPDDPKQAHDLNATWTSEAATVRAVETIAAYRQTWQLVDAWAARGFAGRPPSGADPAMLRVFEAIRERAPLLLRPLMAAMHPSPGERLSAAGLRKALRALTPHIEGGAPLPGAQGGVTPPAPGPTLVGLAKAARGHARDRYELDAAAAAPAEGRARARAATGAGSRAGRARSVDSGRRAPLSPEEAQALRRPAGAALGPIAEGGSVEAPAAELERLKLAPKD